jgi:hypothetical protein
MAAVHSLWEGRTMRGALSLAVGFVVVGGTTGADNPDAAKQLIDRALKAAGGAEKLRQPRGYSYKLALTYSSSSEPDVPSTETCYFQPPSLFRHEGEVKKDGQPRRSVTIINGDRGWYLRDGTVRDMNPIDTKRGDFNLTSFGYKHILPLTEPAFSAEALGPSKVGGRAVEGLKLTRTYVPDRSRFPPSKLPRPPAQQRVEVKWLYFDTNTHLLVRSEQPRTPDAPQDAPRERVVTFEDYKVVDGIAVPHRVTYVTGGPRPATYVHVYSDFKFVDKFDPNLFEKP